MNNYEYEDIDNKVRDLSVMYEVVSSIGTSLDIKIEADNFLGKVLKRFGYDVGSIMIKDSDKSIFSIISAKGYFKTDCLIGTEYTPQQFGIEEVIFEGGSIVKNELSKSDREFIILPYLRSKVNSYAFVPIYFERELLGILRLFSFKKGAFSQRSMRMVASLARRFATTINHIAAITILNITQSLLSDEKEKLLVTLQSIADSVITTDIMGRISFMNKKAEEITGWTAKEALGQLLLNIFCIINSKTGELYQSPLEIVLRAGMTISLGTNITLIAKDGIKKIIVADSCAPIKNKSGNIIGAVLVFKDIIEKELMDKEFIKMKKLESLGLLAGGIAHDFNNLLTAILGNIGLAMAYLPPEHKTYKRLQEGEKASLKARDLVSQLLTFSKGGEPVKKILSIAALIKETASLALIGSNVRCEFFIHDDIWHVPIDEGQIGQVIHNLFLNACQAMSSGGTIKVQCENTFIEKEGVLPIPKGKYVKISVQDEGIGISQENLSKIFDPYYTTKPKGTGLGLSMAYSIIKKHGGYITVDSILGKGTTFVFYLPASKKAVESIKEAKDSKIKTLSDKKKLLVMDDEDMILDFAKEVLSRAGYYVECSKNGRQAIEVYKKAISSGEPFDLVILDFTIPGGMGGKETINRLLKITPNVKAIVTSGYSADPIMTEYKEYGFSSILTKPYKVNDLLKTIEIVIMSG